MENREEQKITKHEKTLLFFAVNLDMCANIQALSPNFSFEFKEVMFFRTARYLRKNQHIRSQFSIE